MNGLGTEVTLLYRGDQILRGFDDDVRDARGGGDARARHRDRDPARDRRDRARRRAAAGVTLDNGETHPADQVLVATGRNPNSARARARGARRRRSARERRGRGRRAGRRPRCPRSTRSATSPAASALTPLAIRDGQAFADTVFGGRPTPVDHALVPTAVFTQPEIAVVGPTEAEARAAGRGRGRTSRSSGRCRTPSPGATSGC